MGQEWRGRAACRGTEGEPVASTRARLALFFPADDPPREGGPSAEVLAAFAEARRICWDVCEVRVECAEFARDTHQFDGVWGGLHGRQLRLWVRGNKRRANAREVVDDVQ